MPFNILCHCTLNSVGLLYKPTLTYTKFDNFKTVSFGETKSFYRRNKLFLP